MKHTLLILTFIISIPLCSTAQKSNLAPTPPMGFMTWNYFGDNITEQDVKSIADAMLEEGLVELGYDYIFIDDGWQGGRDNKNNIIPDPEKFPSGIKALADYLHERGMKLGIYSDAAQLTCAGYTASLGFEEQDAKTFAEWEVDYLKYDYCFAPTDRETAEKRYIKMADALKATDRDIVFAVCEWGQREPWLWAEEAGGQLWRTTYDIRDKWKADAPEGADLHEESIGYGILDILEINAELDEYAGPGGWNDPDMLVVGLHGKSGPSKDQGGTGATNTEYQSQMSLWSLMAAPLMISNDVRNMDDATRAILTNKDILAIDQDPLGKQAKRVINENGWQVFVKPLADGTYAVGILNADEKKRRFKSKLSDLGIDGKYQLFDVWNKETHKKTNKLNFKVKSHETLVFKLTN
ncbi:alpha-galactosidase [Salegentibacter echinorum]|uniref:Alpha-galactosidase n=1 Tax=Salegentibacter echinorum TaxID=1073325 RepID=A0A1M5EAP4_SALEC|nr:glycoside hydrolase family 27 protein [Salegentibacter echinorum]SHF76267.1 alpha-galactosidase [Salegentibacter echinorum]